MSKVKKNLTFSYLQSPWQQRQEEINASQTSGAHLLPSGKHLFFISKKMDVINVLKKSYVDGFHWKCLNESSQMFEILYAMGLLQLQW